MPPKSAKKDLKLLWVSCDKCDVKVIHKKLEFHQNECGSLLKHGVSDGKFVTASIKNSLPPEFDLKDAPTIYMQRFVFIPETVCSLCDFEMGSNLLIEINDKKFVKSSWTVNDKYLDAVFATSEGNNRNQTKFYSFYLYFHSMHLELRVAHDEGSSIITISKLASSKVRPALSLTLELRDELKETKDIERLIRAKLKDTIIHLDTSIIVEFLNKKFVLTIKSIDVATEEDIVHTFEPAVDGRCIL